jgi:DNA repair photolyase
MFLKPDDYAGQFKEYFKKRIAIQWGGLSDQFDGFERKYGVTYELMKFFRDIEYPISFSTKATWFLKEKKYLDLIKNAKNWHFKVSIITNDDEKASKIEQGVPKSSERLKTIEKLRSLKVAGVTLRFRPFIFGVSDPDHLKLIDRAVKRGADSVSFEYFCLEGRATILIKLKYAMISKVCGFDIQDFYNRHSYTTGYKRLNYKFKNSYTNEIRDFCKEKGIRFHVSDAHGKEKGHNGCCCGAPDDFPYFKGQATEVLTARFKQKKDFSFNNLHDHFEIFNDVPWGTATGYNTGNIKKRNKLLDWTMADFIKALWNDPKTASSLHKYLGGSVSPYKINDYKNLVYRFNDVCF